MATVKKGTLTAPPEMWVHLRPYNKRKVAKAERRASKEEVSLFTKEFFRNHFEVIVIKD
jgi:hypothetical protein